MSETISRPQTDSSASSPIFPSTPKAQRTSSTTARRSGDMPVDQSHLPTPSSAGLNSVVVPFFPGVSSPESPLGSHVRGLGNAGPSSLSRLRRSHSPIYAQPTRVPAEGNGMVTPDTSPAGSSKRQETSSLVPRPLSAPLLPSKSKRALKGKPDTSTLKAAKQTLLHLSDDPPTQPNTPDDFQSNLSSPFIEKISLSEEPSSSPLPDPVLVTPQPKSLAQGMLSPVQILETHPEIVKAGEPSTSLLTEPFFPPDAGPSRVPGGELARIREEMSQAEKARISNLESRRPDYLKRRRLDPVVLDETENEGVGILTSPEKGRRIQLIDFQTTSAESFEESLMTHGYGTYGEPRTPQRRTGPNQDTLTWIAYNTPVTKSTTPPPHTEDSALTEKELKKRKRLESFKASASRQPCQLYAVEVEGKGRVLLNVPAEEADEVIGTPAKKRALGKKKKAAVEKKAKSVQRRTEPVNTVLTPNWLDEYQPWAHRNKEWVEKENAEAAERMKLIEHYFSRNTDSEEEDDDNDRENDEEILPSSMWGQELVDPPVPSRRGRGKAVPLQPDPLHPRTPPLRPIQTALEERTRALYFPSDPADARAALLSKRSVRLLEHRRTRQTRPYGARIKRRRDGQLSCICGMDEEDDRPSVQCDRCYNWCHMECIGVKHVSDLGGEDDPWYCPQCRPREASPVLSFPSQAEVYRQPTFAPTDDRPIVPSSRGDVALFSSSPQTSPITRYWGSTGLRSPMRPSRSEHSRLPSWEDPFHIGPSTPYDNARQVRVYTPTGGKFGEFSNEEFESLSAYPTTPSRTFSSMKLNMPFTTPKNNVEGSSGSSAWAARAGNLFATPRNAASRHPIFGSQDEGSASTFMTSRHSLYNADDTPIRRAAPAHHGVRTLLDSPLAPRPGSSQVLSSLTAFEGSPIERRRGPAAGDGPPSPFDFRPGQ